MQRLWKGAGTLRISRNTRNAADRIDRHFAKQGEDVVDTILIGQDPWTHGVHYAIVTRDRHPTDDRCHYMHHVVEWSMHPNPKDASMMPFSSGSFGMTYERALEAAYEFKRRMLTNTWWVVPGTRTRVARSGGQGY